MKLRHCACVLLVLCGCASPTVPTTLDVCLLGRFSFPLDRSGLVRSIEEKGHKVHRDVTPEVDLVVLGGDPISAEGDRLVPVRSMPGFAVAQALGIEIVDRFDAPERLSFEVPWVRVRPDASSRSLRSMSWNCTPKLTR